MFHIFGALAEFERALIRERTQAEPPGGACARTKGGADANASTRDQRAHAVGTLPVARAHGESRFAS